MTNREILLFTGMVGALLFAGYQTDRLNNSKPSAQSPEEKAITDRWYKLKRQEMFPELFKGDGKPVMDPYKRHSGCFDVDRSEKECYALRLEDGREFQLAAWGDVVSVTAAERKNSRKTARSAADTGYPTI